MVCQLKKFGMILGGMTVEDNSCLPPFVEVMDHKDGNIYHVFLLQHPGKYVCSKKRCSLEVYLREEGRDNAANR